jgi:hypothetical protein
MLRKRSGETKIGKTVWSQCNSQRKGLMPVVATRRTNTETASIGILISPPHPLVGATDLGHRIQQPYKGQTNNRKKIPPVRASPSPADYAVRAPQGVTRMRIAGDER